MQNSDYSTEDEGDYASTVRLHNKRTNYAPNVPVPNDEYLPYDATNKPRVNPVDGIKEYDVTLGIPKKLTMCVAEVVDSDILHRMLKDVPSYEAHEMNIWVEVPGTDICISNNAKVTKGGRNVGCHPMKGCKDKVIFIEGRMYKLNDLMDLLIDPRAIKVRD